MTTNQKKIEDLLANSVGQSLRKHLLAVAMRAKQITEDLNINDEEREKIEAAVVVAGLLHDIGKVSPDFQNYIIKDRSSEQEREVSDAESLRPKKFNGPFHNEISCIFYSGHANALVCDYVRVAIDYAIYWHHPANVDKNGEIRFKDNSEIANAVNNSHDSGSQSEGSETDSMGETMQLMSDTIKDLRKYIKEYRAVDDSIGKFMKFISDAKDDMRNWHYPKYNRTDPNEDIDRAVKQGARNRLVLAILIEADRQISKLSVAELDAALEGCLRPPAEPNDTNLPLFRELPEPDGRTKGQVELAKEIAKKPLSVCEIDPGGGKTSIFIHWAMLGKPLRPLIVALPKQVQVSGLFPTILRDLKRIEPAKSAEIKVQAAFNGEVQEHTHCQTDQEKKEQPILRDDINILVFDRLLSPCYERRQFSEFIRMLNSDLVLDEFHEFLNTPLMLPALREILQIRSWLGNDTRTLLLSGTADPALLRFIKIDIKETGDDKVFWNRSSLQPVDPNSKAKLKFNVVSMAEKDGGILSQVETVKDSLISFNIVADAQREFVNMLDKPSKYNLEASYIIHSKFSRSDRKNIMRGLLREYEDDGKAAGLVFAAKILQSSFNLDFKDMHLQTSQPNTDSQTLGRQNRFGKKDGGTVIFYNESNISQFNSDKKGFKKTHNRWKAFLKDKLSDEPEWTHRERMTNLYDSFWTQDSDIVKEACDEIIAMYKNALQALKSWFPRRIEYGVESRTSAENKSRSRGFRGNSLMLSAAVVDNKGKKCGQLEGENLLTESAVWRLTLYKEETKSVSNSYLARVNDTIESFTFKKHVTVHGYVASRPLLCSHVDEKVDGHLKEHLKRNGDNENQSLYRLYHPKIGLISSDIAWSLQSKNSDALERVSGIKPVPSGEDGDE